MEISTTLDSSSPPTPTPTPPPPWIELPADLTANILRRLGVVEILESAEKVCTTWRRVCLDPTMWRVIDMAHTVAVRRRCEMDISGGMHHYLRILCRHAVDRSQGQLIELTLDDFGDDELLNFVVDRSNNLRCLKLHCCFGITGIGLSTAVKKLAHLKELCLFDCRSIKAEDVETIGIACPMLKSFTCKQGYFGNNDFSLAIATTMPNLLHLELAYVMTNEGLEAILDGCPFLESLDLSRCSGLDLQVD